MSTEQTDFAAEFAGGFDETAQDAPAVTIDPEVAPIVTDPVEAATEVAVAQPETVSLTKEQWEQTQARLNEFAQFQQNANKQIDGLAGKFGEVNRNLQNVKQVRPNLSKLKEQFPELGKLFEESLLGGPAPSIDPAEIDRRVNETVQQQSERIKAEMRQQLQQERIEERLSESHSDWKDVLRSPEFEAWRKAQPTERGEQLLTSNDPKFVGQAITDFKAFKEPAKPLTTPRATRAQARLESAITPQGSAVKAPPAKTERDYFKEGFFEGR